MYCDVLKLYGMFLFIYEYGHGPMGLAYCVLYTCMVGYVEVSNYMSYIIIIISLLLLL